MPRRPRAPKYAHTPGYADLDFAKVDLDRLERCGASEVIYGPGKTAPQILKIAQTLQAEKQPVLITRLDAAKARSLKKSLRRFTYDAPSQLGSMGAHPSIQSFTLGVCAAGTSDLPVAEEAARTAEFFGMRVERITDVGVAGIHRLLAQQERLRACDCLIVIAGMEAALPSVVGGLVACPLIAVPTRVGYGWHMEGLGAMLGMLNSCASGMTVVNIDNGFGAAYAALRIARIAAKGHKARS
jgi:pyridinium-3,5-biscarboxylic acid mononucleotide synthase